MLKKSGADQKDRGLGTRMYTYSISYPYSNVILRVQCYQRLCGSIIMNVPDDTSVTLLVQITVLSNLRVLIGLLCFFYSRGESKRARNTGKVNVTEDVFGCVALEGARPNSCIS